MRAAGNPESRDFLKSTMPEELRKTINQEHELDLKPGARFVEALIAVGRKRGNDSAKWRAAVERIEAALGE